MQSDNSDGVELVQRQQLATVVTMLTAVIVVAVLYLARDLFIPLALAVLISFVLAPLARALRRLGVHRAVAVVIVVGFSFGAILGIGALGGSQLAQLADKLPQYQSNLRDKIRSVRGSATGSGPVSQATTVIEDLGREISGDAQKQTTSPTSTPIPVEIRPAPSNPLKLASEFLLPIFSPVATTALVILFVIFFLLQREDLRDRVIKVLGTKELHRTTEAMDEAAARLSRYFLVQTALNAGFGAAVGLALWAIGVPSPLLWGIFTMLMRFVPYIGSILAALFPVALAAAVDPGWTMVALTIALFLIGEPIMGHVIEPLVFGHNIGLSPVAIVVAATFWTWLWGPIGLILATPLTLCLVILGQYTQRLKFLQVMMGDQPALTPAESFYQRLIAGDPAEILDQADLQLKEKTLTQYYDDVALQGLVLAQLDVTRGELSAAREVLLFDGVKDLIEGLAEYTDPVPAGDAKPTPGETADGDDGPGVRENTVPSQDAFLCVAGRGKIDHAAAALLVQLLDRAGIAAQLGGERLLQDQTALKELDSDVPMLCLSYVGTARPAHVRFMVRRLRRKFASAKILIGLWKMPSSEMEWQDIRKTSGADFFVSTFAEALELCSVGRPGVTCPHKDVSSPSSDVGKLKARDLAPAPIGN